MNIPPAVQEKYDPIASLIRDFCRQHLNEDYEVLCLRLLEDLCSQQPSPLRRGRVNTWAAGILYAIGSNNYLFDKSQKVHMTAGELAAPFGLAASTAANKANEIARLCDVNHLEARWVLPELAEQLPETWFVSLNGRIIDLRTAPLPLQLSAYHEGIIPIVPAFVPPYKCRYAPYFLRHPENGQGNTPDTSCTGSAPEPDDYSDIYRAFGVEP